MNPHFKDTYFQYLPAEVLVHILSFVETVDLLSFCDLYDCDYFLRDAGVVKCINLYKRYCVRHLRQLTTSLRVDSVTAVNINCMYWVSVQDLRKFIAKLPNLEHLHALKTPLALEDKDVAVYNRTKVSKLAVTVRNLQFNQTKVHTINSLCLDMTASVKGNFEPTILVWKFPNIKRLWLEMQEGKQQYLTLTAFVNGVSEKIFCKISAAVPPINYCYLGLERYYNERKLKQPYIVCCERMELADFFETETEIYAAASEPWKTLYELHTSKPYGPEDAKRIFMNEFRLDDIEFQELNFSHHGPVCNLKVIKAAREILSKPNTRCIKKLCVMMCLMQYSEESDQVIKEDTVTFKKKRVAVDKISNSDDQIKQIFENMHCLEHLEIYFCDKTTLRVNAAISAFPLIANLTQLTQLILEIPVSIDGSFLLEVLKNCTLLQCLSVTAFKQHEKLNVFVNRAVAFGKSLKDFRYENYRVQPDRLIESLCEIKTHKIERLMIVCKEIDKFSSGPLRRFLEYNTQLIFLYFIIEHGSKAFLKMVQETLNEYKKRHPANIYLITKTKLSNHNGFPIPDVHYQEMVQRESTTSNLNAYEQFMAF